MPFLSRPLDPLMYDFIFHLFLFVLFLQICRIYALDFIIF